MNYNSGEKGKHIGSVMLYVEDLAKESRLFGIEDTGVTCSWGMPFFETNVVAHSGSHDCEGAKCHRHCN